MSMGIPFRRSLQDHETLPQTAGMSDLHENIIASVFGCTAHTQSPGPRTRPVIHRPKRTGSLELGIELSETKKKIRNYNELRTSSINLLASTALVSRSTNSMLRFAHNA